MHRLVDRYAGIGSPLHRLDPRSKLIALTLAIVAIASLPTGGFHRFVWAYAGVVLLVTMSRVPVAHFGRRLLMVSPVVLTSAALLYWTQSGVAGQQAATSVALRSYAAVILLTLLTATCRFQHLLWAFQRLHLPHALYVIASLMHRYLELLQDQWFRMTQARQSRAGTELRVSRAELYGKQLGLVFVRSSDRAERLQAAMMARGFTGEFPATYRHSFGAADYVFVVLCPAVFFAIRLLP